MREPLAIDRNNWRSRWLVLASWKRLHRIAEITWERTEDYQPPGWVIGQGVAVCGARGQFVMPGLFSRMGLERCAHCCRALGIELGNGNPYNQGVDV